MQTFTFKRFERKVNVITLLILSSFLWSCDAIFEPDITNKQVTILAPVDGYCSTSQTVLFWWEELEGASNYRIQVAKPSFDSIEQLIMDSLVVGDKISLYLQAGNYQWRLRAENSAYFSQYMTRNFTILSSEDLSSQSVNLISPINFDTLNSATVSFSWSPVDNATQYRFEIYSPDLAGDCILSTAAYSTNYQFSFTSDSTFLWRVRAENNQTNTEFFSRVIYLDTQAPSAPSLLYPLNASTLTSSLISFQWQHDESGGSAIYDSIFLATDISFSNLIFSEQSLYQAYTDSLSAGIYYWRVRSYDTAGNTGDFSNIFQLIVE